MMYFVLCVVIVAFAFYLLCDRILYKDKWEYAKTKRDSLAEQLHCCQRELKHYKDVQMKSKKPENKFHPVPVLFPEGISTEEQLLFLAAQTTMDRKGDKDVP